MDLFSEIYCMGGLGDGHGPGGIRINGPGGGIFMPMPPGFPRGCGGGMFGGGGGMGGGRQVLYDDESDDDDDYDHSDYVRHCVKGVVPVVLALRWETLVVSRCEI